MVDMPPSDANDPQLPTSGVSSHDGGPEHAGADGTGTHAGTDAVTDAGIDTSSATGASNIAAFFDVDNTIIRGASAFHLARALHARGFFAIKDLLVAGYHQMRYISFGENKNQIEAVRERALSIMKGHSVAEVTAIGEEVYDQVLALRIYPGTRKILDAHLAAGHQVWLITATPIEIGELLARRLNATGALATVAEHKDGIYTGRLVGDMMHGKGKERGVRELAERLGIDLSASYAYGDSANDIPILSAVGNPCAINPEPRLRKHARQVGWPLREFRGKRRIAKRGLKTASWAGAAWVLSLMARAAKRSLTSRTGH